MNARISRTLLRVGFIAALVLGVAAADQQSPGIVWLFIQAVGVGAKGLLISGYWAVVVLAAATFVGYVLCLIRHHAAIAAARIERRHEHRIIALRNHNHELSAHLRAEARWNQ